MYKFYQSVFFIFENKTERMPSLCQKLEKLRQTKYHRELLRIFFGQVPLKVQMILFMTSAMAPVRLVEIILFFNICRLCKI